MLHVTLYEPPYPPPPPPHTHTHARAVRHPRLPLLPAARARACLAALALQVSCRCRCRRHRHNPSPPPLPAAWCCCIRFCTRCPGWSVTAFGSATRAVRARRAAAANFMARVCVPVADAASASAATPASNSLLAARVCSGQRARVPPRLPWRVVLDGQSRHGLQHLDLQVEYVPLLLGNMPHLEPHTSHLTPHTSHLTPQACTVRPSVGQQLCLPLCALWQPQRRRVPAAHPRRAVCPRAASTCRRRCRPSCSSASCFPFRCESLCSCPGQRPPRQRRRQRRTQDGQRGSQHQARPAPSLWRYALFSFATFACAVTCAAVPTWAHT
jgi:hypothetical protein